MGRTREPSTEMVQDVGVGTEHRNALFKAAGLHLTEWESASLSVYMRVRVRVLQTLSEAAFEPDCRCLEAASLTCRHCMISVEFC